MVRSKKRKRSKSPPEIEGGIMEGGVGVYYMERPEVKQALRMLAANEGHNSIAKVIREATLQYLKSQNVPDEWLVASSD